MCLARVPEVDAAADGHMKREVDERAARWAAIFNDGR
jgi:hypothetical protein